MGAIRHLTATAIVLLVTFTGVPAFATGGIDHPVLAPGNDGINGLLPVRGAERHDAVDVAPVADSGRAAVRPSPAVSLDPRVPAAQVTDREGLSLVGVLGAVGELRHAFSRKDREQPADGGVARVVRTLRDSVFGKRISILSESGRIAENNPCLVGFSFTH